MTREYLTFDDVLLEPKYSAVLPSAVDVKSVLTAKMSLALPLISAAMDTVTESQMAIAMAQAGGLGAIHKNLPPPAQAEEVERVKRFASGIVYKPITVAPQMTVKEVLGIKNKHNISGLPVVDDNGGVVGIVTNRDLRFATNKKLLISELMTPAEKLITIRPEFKLTEAKNLLHKHRIERLVIIDKRGKLCGLMTVKDILNNEQYPNANKDAKGRLCAAAAVGVDDGERAGLLVEAGVDALVIDSAHGHSAGIIAAVRRYRKDFPDVALIAGNISTTAGALALADAGADVIKVGIGPGSICTTRIIAGVGVPQISAIQMARRAFKRKRPAIVADGGVRYSGDIAKAIAAGADAVMVGNILAGSEEAPGEVELYQGRAYKRYQGMGSLNAMRAGSGERYFQDPGETAKLVPEGVEGRVPYKGKVAATLYQLVGGLRAAMGYVGAKDLSALQKAEFVRVTAASIRESHVHDVEITREAPNYRVE